jgi:hypothetical protein
LLRHLTQRLTQTYRQKHPMPSLRRKTVVFGSYANSCKKQTIKITSL